MLIPNHFEISFLIASAPQVTKEGFDQAEPPKKYGRQEVRAPFRL